MSAPVPQPCIRGCRRKAFDPDTREPAGTEPVPAEVGLLCADDAKRLMRWLLEIPDLYATLDPRIGGGDPMGSGKRHKVSGSPALARLDVLVLQDPRTTAAARYYEPGDDTAPTSDVPSLILSWAECLCDDMNITHRPDNLAAGIQLLTGGWFDNLCYRPWVDEMFTDIKSIRDHLRRTNGVRGPRSIGVCEADMADGKRCGTRLYAPEHGGMITCRTCGHTMDGVAIIRLRVAQSITDMGSTA